MASYYTIPEFAKLKKTTRQTIYNAIAREELEYAKLYGKILIRKTGKNDSWKVNKSQQRFKNKYHSQIIKVHYEKPKHYDQ